MTNFKIIGPKIIPFRLIEQKQESTTLVIVLPGAGYTVQAPLLHFTTALFYNKGFDVLHINYTFSREEMSALKESDFARDVQLAIESAIKDKKYSNYYVVAKSIGTKALSYLLDHTMFKDARIVWLTPILQNDAVFHAMVNSNQRGLCIIGDKDSCFIKERFENLKHNQNLLLKVVEGGNHSLELDGEPLESIDVLKDVVFEIDKF
ncbi:alpha/beta family hydrolase [Bacillus sp. AK128]